MTHFTRQSATLTFRFLYRKRTTLNFSGGVRCRKLRSPSPKPYFSQHWPIRNFEGLSQNTQAPGQVFRQLGYTQRTINMQDRYFPSCVCNRNPPPNLHKSKGTVCVEDFSAQPTNALGRIGCRSCGTWPGLAAVIVVFLVQGSRTLKP